MSNEILERKLNDLTSNRYKSTKGDADKRKQTSRDNMAKARQAKLDKKKERENEQEIEIESESESEELVSSSEEELVISKKPKKSKKPISGGGDDRITRLEKAIYNLSIRKSKPKQVIERKTIINNVQPQAQQQLEAPYPNVQKQQLLRLI